MKELRGKLVSDNIKNECLREVATFDGDMPALAILRVGDNEADISYERGVKKKFIDFGLEVKDYALPSDVTDEEFKETFDFLNNDTEIHGILIMRPLPKHIDEKYIIDNLKPEKDLDGITNENIAGVMRGDKTAFAPCTAQAVIEMLKGYDISLSGKEVAIMGRSMVVGKPLSMLLLSENATVTVCHSKTEDIKSVTSRADILVVAIGKAKSVGSSYIKEDAIVVDVGINMDTDGKLVGDCDYDTIATRAQALTPVPGGLGAVTTAVLAKHLVEAYKKQVIR